MRQFEYDIQRFAITDKWNAKKQAEEMTRLTQQLNEKGNQGWELLGLHSFDLVGGITGSSKGEITLTIWKREVSKI